MDSPEIAQMLFCNHKKSSDILKLAVVHQSSYIFDNALVKFYET